MNIDQTILKESENKDWQNYKPRVNKKGSWVKSFRAKSEVDLFQAQRVIVELIKIGYENNEEIRNYLLNKCRIGISQIEVDKIIKLLKSS